MPKGQRRKKNYKTKKNCSHRGRKLRLVLALDLHTFNIDEYTAIPRSVWLMKSFLSAFFLKVFNTIVLKMSMYVLIQLWLGKVTNEDVFSLLIIERNNWFLCIIYCYTDDVSWTKKGNLCQWMDQVDADDQTQSTFSSGSTGVERPQSCPG